jgi:hypothetical protein
LTKIVSRLSVAALSVVAVGVVDASTANADSGCKTSDMVSVCMSLGNGNIEPDYYLNSDNPANSCVQVDVKVVRATKARTQVWEDSIVNNGCVIGHHGPWGLNPGNTGGHVFHGSSYLEEVTVTRVNGTLGPFDSPIAYY